MKENDIFLGCFDNVEISMNEIKELCRYERLMLIHHNINSEFGKIELSLSVKRIIEYMGKRLLSNILGCNKEEVDFVLAQMITSIQTIE